MTELNVIAIRITEAAKFRFTISNAQIRATYITNMKLTCAIALASFAVSNAFTAPWTKQSTSSLNMVNFGNEERVQKQEDAVVPTSKEELSKRSTALPFLSRPAALDGSMVGDVGFDPLGLAQSEDQLFQYREAEIKHARLAMLAAVGWPLSEIFDRKLAQAADLSPVVDASDRAPSVLNGGLEKISTAYWAITLLTAAAIDVYGINRSKNAPDYFPGNLGFDPLGLFPKDAEGQRQMQLKELKNGRLAMIAITGFAFQEFATKLAVVDETPFFFTPLGTTLHEQALAGTYVNPN